MNFQGISGYLSDVGNTDEMAENALKILKDNTDSDIIKIFELIYNPRVLFHITSKHILKYKTEKTQENTS